ncbi:MAG: sugar transferase [Bacteroidales bacterium]|nr:sugar transferase [Bacteroidales bacterium]
MTKIFAAIILIILSPLLLGVVLVLKLFGKGPVIFKQNRLGINKDEFTILKFRTMTDGKISQFGSVLRKTGIDELPQLFNILKGEMAFVGPRPLTQDDIYRLDWNDIKYKARWSVKPGITGAAQLLKICDKNLSMKRDLSYVEKKCLWLDLKIILQSILIPIIGKKQKNRK